MVELVKVTVSVAVPAQGEGRPGSVKAQDTERMTSLQDVASRRLGRG